MTLKFTDWEYLCVEVQTHSSGQCGACCSCISHTDLSGGGRETHEKTQTSHCTAPVSKIAHCDAPLYSLYSNLLFSQRLLECKVLCAKYSLWCDGRGSVAVGVVDQSVEGLIYPLPKHHSRHRPTVTHTKQYLVIHTVYYHMQISKRTQYSQYTTGKSNSHH